MKKIISFILLFYFFSVLSIGQATIIELKNPSFEEDPPRAGKIPYKWNDCSFPGETPPDIQPGSFGVSQQAFDGGTYLGMVTRDNDSWERISQQLSKPLVNGQCYEFSIYISRSEIYLSASQLTKSLVQYNKPIVLRIWGGNDPCSKIEKLVESEPSTSNEWERYTFIFRPTETYTHLLLEAFYETPTLYPYNGNILLDNASPIVLIDCESIDNTVTSYKEKSSSPTTTSETYAKSETYTSKDDGIYHIPSLLDSKKMDELITKIHIYLSTNSKYAAEIYIADEDRKAAKITERLIIDRLSRRGWKEKEDYSIFR